MWLIYLPVSARTMTTKDDIFATLGAKGELLICPCGDRLRTNGASRPMLGGKLETKDYKLRVES